jgi:hypothetical protein
MKEKFARKTEVTLTEEDVKVKKVKKIERYQGLSSIPFHITML